MAQPLTIPTDERTGGRRGLSVYAYLLAVLLLVAVLEFMARGCLRAWHDSGDLATQYAATIAWRQGQNPYDMNIVPGLYLAQGGSPEVAPNPSGTPSVYPPTSFVVLAPLSFLPWSAAKIAVCLLNIVAVLLTVWVMLRHFGRDWKPEYRIGFAALVFGFAPLHTAVSKGQLVPVAFAGMMVAWIWAREQKQLPSGLLLGLVTCLKPQLVGMLVLLYLLRGAWKAAAAAIGVVAGVGIIALLGLMRSGADWLGTWRLNLQNPVHSAGPENPMRVQMLNSQVLFNFLFGDALPWTLLIGALVLAALVWLFIRRHAIGEREEPLILSLLLLLNLLAMYHRFYDATVLLVFALVVWEWLRQGERTRAIVGLCCLAVFLFPGAVLIQQLTDSGRLPLSGIILSVALCHQIIALIVATVLIVLSAVSTVGKPRASAGG
jgi:hypothetical protein